MEADQIPPSKDLDANEAWGGSGGRPVAQGGLGGSGQPPLNENLNANESGRGLWEGGRPLSQQELERNIIAFDFEIRFVCLSTILTFLSGLPPR